MTAVTAKRFSIAEYHRLGELGFFEPDRRIELIRGEIIIMAAKGTFHSVCNSLLFGELYALVGKRAIVRGQEPIILMDDSEPEPDVVIARNRSDNYLSSHPESADILLVIEVAILLGSTIGEPSCLSMLKRGFLIIGYLIWLIIN